MASDILDTSIVNNNVIQEPWHPKLTPYRLLVLSTTIGLGTAKALTAELGHISTSTTLEWISGVVVFLILQCVSAYDSPGSAAPYPISWMFTADCMDFIWNIFRIYSLPRPKYCSDEVLYRDDDRKSDHPPITLYRLLVCSAVVCFGVTKAALAYVGYSTVASGIDWTSGVLVTTILYCVGLYENSSARKWQGFFMVDYSGPVNSVMIGLVFLDIILMAISAGWMTFCTMLLREICLVEWNESVAESAAFTGVGSQLVSIFSMIMLITLLLFAIGLGGFFLLLFFLRIGNRSRLGRLFLSAFSIPTLPSLMGRQFSWNTALRVLIHVAVYLPLILFCISTSLINLGFVLQLFKPEGIIAYFGCLYLLLIAAGAAFFAWKYSRDLLRPWFIYRNQRGSDWESELLFS